MTKGPFEKGEGLSTKRVFIKQPSSSAQIKTREEQIENLVNGVLKFEYKLSGDITGSFKSPNAPSAISFKEDAVIHRGRVLIGPKYVVCIVLNVGNQCMVTPMSMRYSERLDPEPLIGINRDFEIPSGTFVMKYYRICFLTSLAFGIITEIIAEHP